MSSPVPQKCHSCDAVFAGCACPQCGAERPALALIKKLSPPRLDTVRELAPVGATGPRCLADLSHLCYCGHRRLCLQAA